MTRGVKAERNRREERMVMVDRDGVGGCRGVEERVSFLVIFDFG
jgi:hypothetical protein